MGSLARSWRWTVLGAVGPRANELHLDLGRKLPGPVLISGLLHLADLFLVKIKKERRKKKGKKKKRK